MVPFLRLLPSITRGAVCLVLAGVGVFGCSATPTGAGAPWQDDPERAGKCYPAVEKPVADQLAASLVPPAEVAPAGTRPLQVLVVSGGVAGAPFSAGVLVGWTESDTR